MKKLIEEYKINRDIYKKYSGKDKMFSAISDIWKRKIKKITSILKVLENDELTPKFFKTLDTQDQWTISKHLTNVIWCCAWCNDEMINENGEIVNPKSTFNEIYCANCEFLLTRRTGGGMSDPFGWTFKYNKKETRKRKLKSLSGDKRNI